MRLLFFFLSFSLMAFSQESKWTGFEIVGSRSVSKEKITRLVPLRLGDPFHYDQVQWDKWCETIHATFQFAAAQCSAMGFLDFRSYFVISIVEKGQEYRLRFRKTPDQTVPIQDPELFTLYDQLMKRLWELFHQGISSEEFTHGDYLDFKDPQMHTLVMKLVERAPAARENLLRIIRFHKETSVRATAAWLLCWAGNPQDSISRVFDLLDDPEMLVRNDISRFMTHWISQLSEQAGYRKLIDALVLQIKRPSHADRNKGLINLLSYLRTHREAIAYFKGVGMDEVRHIARNSVLDNVGALAHELELLCQAS